MYTLKFQEIQAFDSSNSQKIKTYNYIGELLDHNVHTYIYINTNLSMASCIVNELAFSNSVKIIIM